MKRVAALLAAALWSGAALAAQAPDTPVVTGPNNAQVPIGNLLITPPGGTQQKLGDALANSSGSSVTPTGAPTALPLPTIASQQGVLLDAFKVSGDPDDTASMTRAVAAGVPILLGPKTYTVNNFQAPATTNVTIVGVPGRSVIQRTNIGANTFIWMDFTLETGQVYLSGIIFDANSAGIAVKPRTQVGIELATSATSRHYILQSVVKNNTDRITFGSAIAIFGHNEPGNQSLIQNTEITNNGGSAIYIGSASNVTIDSSNIHDNLSVGIAYLMPNVGYPSTFGTVSNSSVLRNGSTGIEFGGFSAPYDNTTNVQVTDCVAVNNLVQDNGGSGITLQGDRLQALGNRILLSSGVAAFNAISIYGRWPVVRENYIYTVLGSSADGAVDFGGSLEAVVENNEIYSPGAAVNGGGSSNSTIRFNKITVPANATGVSVNRYESDGSGSPFPGAVTGLRITDNLIIAADATSSGIVLKDGAGQPTTTAPIGVYNNDFQSLAGVSLNQNTTLVALGANYEVQNNRILGSSRGYADPSAQGNLIFPDALDIIRGLGSVVPIASFIPSSVSTGRQTVTYVTVTTPGIAYNPATTTISITTTGSGSGATAVPFFNANGSVAFVRMTNRGSGYFGGTVSATLVDTSGNGSGGVLTPTLGSVLPVNKRLTYLSSVATSINGLASGFPVIKVPGGQAMQVRIQSAVTLHEQDNLWNLAQSPPNAPALQAASPATGTTVTIADSTSYVNLTPAGTLATLTLALPLSPTGGQVRVMTSQTLTALAWTPNTGQTLSGAPTTLSANGTATLVLSGTVWTYVGP